MANSLSPQLLTSADRLEKDWRRLSAYATLSSSRLSQALPTASSFPVGWNLSSWLRSPSFASI